VYLDAAGNTVRAEQVLTERNFSQINPGMTADDVRLVLGRPGEVEGFGALAWDRLELPLRKFILLVVPSGELTGADCALGGLWGSARMSAQRHGTGSLNVII